MAVIIPMCRRRRRQGCRLWYVNYAGKSAKNAGGIDTDNDADTTHNSNGQTRDLPTAPRRPQPPPLARPHHHSNRLSTLPPPRIRQTAHLGPGTDVQPILRLVRRSLRPRQQQACHRHVQEDGVQCLPEGGPVLQR